MVSVVGLHFFMITACSHCSFNQITLFQVPFLLYFCVSGMIFPCTEQWNLCCSPHSSIRMLVSTWLTLFCIKPCAEVQPFLILDPEFAFLLVCNLGKLIIQLMPLTQYQVQGVVLSNPFSKSYWVGLWFFFLQQGKQVNFKPACPKASLSGIDLVAPAGALCMHANSNENSC